MSRRDIDVDYVETKYMQPLLFAISAVPGAGKSALIARLKARFPGCRALAQDDFATATTWPFEDVVAWFSRGADCNEFDVSALAAQLRQELREANSPTPLFLETHFGRQHAEIGPLVDRLVWIDVPLDIALARQMRAFALETLRQPGGGDAADFLRWQQFYLEKYSNHIQHMYRAQRDKIRPTADLVVDGRAAAEEIADTVAYFVATTLRR